MGIVQTPGDTVVHAALVYLELIENEFWICCKISKESTSVGVGGVAQVETAGSLTGQAICVASPTHLLSLSDFNPLTLRDLKVSCQPCLEQRLSLTFRFWFRCFSRPISLSSNGFQDSQLRCLGRAASSQVSVKSAWKRCTLLEPGNRAWNYVNLVLAEWHKGWITLE